MTLGVMDLVKEAIGAIQKQDGAIMQILSQRIAGRSIVMRHALTQQDARGDQIHGHSKDVK